MKEGNSVKKIMFVGSIGVGKTTLTQRLQGEAVAYAKTQAIQFHDFIIDTPGEFVQHRRFYNALTVTSAEVDVIGLLLSAQESSQIFTQGFAALFNKPVIGILTKMDLVTDESQIAYTTKQLKEAGVKEIFKVSALDDNGINELRAYLNE